MIRLLRILYRLLWALALSVLVALALYASLGRQYIDLLGDYRQQLIAEIEQRTGVAVQIASLQGDWAGLAPVIGIQNLVLGEQRGIAIDRASIEFNLLSSLLLGRPQLNHIRIEEMALALQQNDAGQWSVAGLRGQGGGPPSWLVDTLLGIHNASLGRLDLHLDYADGSRRRLQLKEFSLDSDGGFRRVFARLDTDQGGGVSVLTEAYGDPREVGSFHASAYLQINNSRFSALAPLFPGSAPLINSMVNGELWLNWRRQQRLSMVGQLSAAELAVGALWDDPEEQLSDVAMRFTGSHRDGNWQLSFAEFRAAWRQQQLDLAGLSLRHLGEKRWRLALPALEVAPFVALLDNAGVLPAPLKALAPVGSLAHIQLGLAPGDDDKMRFALEAQMQDLSVQAWQGAPGAEGISGYLQLAPDQGRAVVDSARASLNFPQLYDAPFQLQALRGELRWWLGDQRLRLRSGVLRASEGEQALAASLALDLPLSAEAPGGDPRMTLALGAEDVQANRHRQFVPRILAPSLLAWLDQSIVGGRAETASFLYHGSLKPGSEEARSVQLVLDLAEAELKYQPDWPAIAAQQAQLYLDNGRLTATASGASLWQEFALQAVSIRIRETPAGSPELSVSARAQPNVRQGLRLLTETPIAQRLNGALDAWQGQGSSQVDFQLKQVLTAGAAPRIKVAAALDVQQLQLPRARLNLEAISGRLDYSSREGLSSHDLQVRLFDQPVVLRVTQPGEAVQVEGRGTVTAADLMRWLGQPQVELLKGQAMVKLHIDTAQPASLTLQSDMQGLEIRLPQPLFKAAEEPRAFALSMPLGQARQTLTLNVAEQLALRLGFEEGGIAAGHLRLGSDQAPPLPAAGFVLDGHLPFASLPQWQMALANLQQGAPAAARGAMAPSLQLAELTIGELEAFSQLFSDVSLSGELGGSETILTVAGPQLQGDIVLPASSGRPIRLTLEQLSLQSLSQGGGGTAATVLDPRQFPALVVDIAQLEVAGQAWGSLGFDLRSDQQGATFSRLRGELRGLRLGVGEEPSELSWWRDAAGDRSQLRGRVKLGDIGSVLERWGYDRAMESEDGEVVVDLRWPGPPDAWQLLASQGTLDFALEDGRFLKSSEAASGALRLLSVFNMANIVRRLQFDFRDVFSSGIAFDQMRGGLKLDDGMLFLAEPLRVKGPSSAFEMTGNINMRSERPDMRLVATLPVGSNLPWLAALVGGLPAAAGAYIVSKVFEEQVDSFSSAVYDVSGTVQNPELTFRQIFDVDNTGGEAAPLRPSSLR